MKFQSKKVNTKSLGECLRERRKEFGLTVKEASRRSRVQPKYIQALERGEFSSLPAPVYVLGFLRDLAHVYKLKQRDLLERFEEEKRISDNITPKNSLPEARESLLPRFVLSPKTLTILGVGLLGILSLGYLYSQFRSLNAAPPLVIISPGQDGTVDSGLLQVEGETEPGSKLFINNQPAVVDADGNFSQNLSLALGSNQIVFRSRNRFDEETTITRTIVFQEKEVAGSFDATTEEEEQVSAPETDEFVLEIYVEDEAAWVELVADDELVFSGTMLPGASREIDDADKVVITSGNAGATRIVINGQDQGVLGGGGEVVREREFLRP